MHPETEKENFDFLEPFHRSRLSGHAMWLKLLEVRQLGLHSVSQRPIAMLARHCRLASRFSASPLLQDRHRHPHFDSQLGGIFPSLGNLARPSTVCPTASISTRARVPQSTVYSTTRRWPRNPKKPYSGEAILQLPQPARFRCGAEDIYHASIMSLSHREVCSYDFTAQHRFNVSLAISSSITKLHRSHRKHGRLSRS